MAKIGKYEILDELHRSSQTVVFVASREGAPSDRRFAIKLFLSEAQFAGADDEAEPHWEAQAFLDHARTQQRVAVSGARHWAPVYDLGKTDAGAYFVTDYCPLTAAKLLAARVPVNSAALQAVAGGIVAGLEELRGARRRAWGHLTPGNVLLQGAGDLADASVLLTDLGSPAVAARTGEAGDLLALGELLFALVIGRPHHDADEWPVPAAPRWSSLGESGESWRQLISDLLAPDPAQRPNGLHALARRLGRMGTGGVNAPPAVGAEAPPPPALSPVFAPPAPAPRADAPRRPVPAPQVKPPAPPRSKGLRIALAAACLLAAGALALFWVLNSSARKEFCGLKQDWLGSFAGAMADPVRRSRYQQDPDLRVVVTEIANTDPASIDCESAGLSFSRYQRLRAAVAAARRIDQQLLPEHWRQLGRVVELQKRLEKQGWAQPAAFAAKLASDVRPASGADIAQGIDRVLQVEPALSRDVAAADASWKQLADATAALAATRDRSLAISADSLRQSAVAALRLSDSGLAGQAELKSNAATAEQMLAELHPPAAQATELHPPAVEVTVGPGPARHAAPVPAPESQPVRVAQTQPVRVAQSQPVQVAVAPPPTPTPPPPQTRPVQVAVATAPAEKPAPPPPPPPPAPIVQREKIDAAAAALRQRLAVVSRTVTESMPDPAAAAAFDKAQRDAEASVAAFEKTPFVEQDLTSGAFARRQSKLEASIDALARYVHHEMPQDWISTLGAMTSSSPKINAYWDAWRQLLGRRADEMAADPSVFQDYKRKTPRLETALKELDRSFPAPPADLSPKFHGVAAEKREQEIVSMLDDFDPRNGHLDLSALPAARELATRWIADLQGLSKDFPITKPLLLLDDRPDLKWRSEKFFWNDPLVQGLVKPDVERLDRLALLRTLPREKLMKAATDTAEPEVALAAWQLLGADSVAPAWPAASAELWAELALRKKVDDLLHGVQDAPARASAIAGVRREEPRRWRRFVERADKEEMLAAALQTREAFGVDADEFARVSPRARFDLWLYVARDRMKQEDNAAVLDAVENMKKALTDLRGPGLPGLLARLEGMAARQPFADQRPGDLFKIKLTGAEPLQFKRVEPSGKRPFYLGTEEVSVAQFAAAVSAASAWEQAKALPWAYLPNERDRRQGPRGWEWVTKPSLTIAPPDVWLVPEDANDFPPSLRGVRFNRELLSDAAGGNPGAQHPMQQLPAEAALWFANLCGCRLPTSSEWLAAYNGTEKVVPADRWNLRDQTWEQQRRYVAPSAIPPGQWPDAGIFHGPDDKSATGEAARGRTESDGVLFFRPVTAGGPAAGAPAAGGRVFHELVGNVAEFLCDASESFESWSEKASAQGIHTFVAQQSGSLYVVGGSALSPPETPVDKPLPLAHADESYSDVGVRLAFTAPARSVSERLKWVLGDQTYIWQSPAGSAASAGK